MRAAGNTIAAFAAHVDEGADNSIAGREPAYAFADFDHGSRAFMAENERQRHADGAVDGRQIAVAYAAGAKLDHHLAAVRRFDLDLLHHHRPIDLAADDCFCHASHADSPYRFPMASIMQPAERNRQSTYRMLARGTACPNEWPLAAPRGRWAY